MPRRVDVLLLAVLLPGCLEEPAPPPGAAGAGLALDDLLDLEEVVQDPPPPEQEPDATREDEPEGPLRMAVQVWPRVAGPPEHLEFEATLTNAGQTPESWRGSRCEHELDLDIVAPSGATRHLRRSLDCHGPAPSPLAPGEAVTQVFRLHTQGRDGPLEELERGVHRVTASARWIVEDHDGVTTSRQVVGSTTFEWRDRAPRPTGAYDGLRMSVEASTTSFGRNESTTLRVEVRNEGEQTVHYDAGCRTPFHADATSGASGNLFLSPDGDFCDEGEWTPLAPGQVLRHERVWTGTWYSYTDPTPREAPPGEYRLRFVLPYVWDPEAPHMRQGVSAETPVTYQG